jgi:hypothetical protein
VCMYEERWFDFVLPLSTGVFDARSPPGAVMTYSMRGLDGSERLSNTAELDGFAAITVTVPLVPYRSGGAQCAYTSTSLSSSPVTLMKRGCSYITESARR